MSIQIIDGFQVNASTPIDNRIVASGSTARNAIPYKYEGLRVFDTSNGIPYVWLNGGWVSENASGIVGSGTAEYIPLYTSSNVISNSLLYQYNGIIKTADTGNGSDLVEIDPEYGTVYAQAGFYGPGSNITQIDGSNINNGSINAGKITIGSTGQVLVSGTATASWTNQSQLSVGTASNSTNSTNSKINRESSSIVTHYLNFVPSGAWAGIGSSNEGVKSNHLDLTYVPGTRTLSVGTVSSTKLVTTGDVRVGTNLNCVGGLIDIGTTSGSRNAYLFSGNTNVTELASYNNRPIIFSTGNTSITERMRITDSGIKHVSTSFTNPGNVGSFVVGTGNLSRTTQITIASVAYDRVIYVYSSSNSNNYYSTSGFFEIEIYIINGGVNQQVYTVFHGNDSDIRPTGLGYNYILPAGSSSTISLYKGNSLAWNTGSGPTIYATSLKFGL